MDTNDRIDRDVDIYISVDAVRDLKQGTEDFDKIRIKTPQHTGDLVRIRNYRVATVCLVLLCFLLMIAVIVLSVYIHTNNTNYSHKAHQLLTKITNLTEDKVWLLTNFTNLKGERDQLLSNNTKLTEERHQLLIQNENLTTEQKQLILKNGNLTKERDQLKSEKVLVDGWTHYQYSLYSISSEKKNWDDSKKDCRGKGADLVIINNKVEQDIVKNISAGDKVWIGLSDSAAEDTWKWADGTNLNFRFWGSTEPNGETEENCALSYSLGWADYPCSYAFKWICEKTIFK